MMEFEQFLVFKNILDGEILSTYNISIYCIGLFIFRGCVSLQLDNNHFRNYLYTVCIILEKMLQERLPYVSQDHMVLI